MIDSKKTSDFTSLVGTGVAVPGGEEDGHQGSNETAQARLPDGTFEKRKNSSCGAAYSSVTLASSEVVEKMIKEGKRWVWTKKCGWHWESGWTRLSPGTWVRSNSGAANSTSTLDSSEVVDTEFERWEDEPPNATARWVWSGEWGLFLVGLFFFS